MDSGLSIAQLIQKIKVLDFPTSEDLDKAITELITRKKKSKFPEDWAYRHEKPPVSIQLDEISKAYHHASLIIPLKHKYNFRGYREDISNKMESLDRVYKLKLFDELGT